MWMVTFSEIVHMPTLRRFSAIGRLLMVLVVMLLPVGCLRTPMSGLVVVLFLMRLLVLRLLGLGFVLDYVFILWGTVGGALLMTLVLLWMVQLRPAGGFALFLVHCRLCRGLSFGRSSLLCRLLMLFIWVLIISMLFGTWLVRRCERLIAPLFVLFSATSCSPSAHKAGAEGLLSHTAQRLTIFSFFFATVLLTLTFLTHRVICKKSNLNVVRPVGRLLDGVQVLRPEFEDDGDLIGLIRKMVRSWGEGQFTFLRSKVMRKRSCFGVVRFGNNQAADFGRCGVGPHVIDARRNLSGVCGRWYPVVLVLHLFFIAISRAVVNDDGSVGTAPHLLVLCPGALPKRRRVVHAVRDVALLHGPAPVWDSGWVSVLPTSVTADDVCHWPYSVGVPVKLVAFLCMCIGQYLVLIWVLAVSPMLSSFLILKASVEEGCSSESPARAPNFRVDCSSWSRH